MSDRTNDSLRFLETPLIGAWIASVVVLWVMVSGLREYPGFAIDLERYLRTRVALGEACIGAFVILLLLRRGDHGIRLALAFFAIAALVVSAIWLAPDLQHLDLRIASVPNQGSLILADRARLIRLALGGVDALRAVLLFSLLSCEMPRRAHP